MDNNTETTEKAKSVWAGILDTALKVIKDAPGFYRGMAKGGGFGDPLVFLVVMGVIGGVVRAVLGLFHLGGIFSIGMAFAALVATPVIVIIAGFIGAAILFVIWKLMGSTESYETAYRCGAYASAMTPILALVNAIPIVGMLAGLAWMVYVLVIASVEVHKIAAKTAWLVFGIIGLVLALMGGCSSLAARKMQKQAEAWQSRSGKDMTPEEAGKAAAAFVKAMQEAAAKEAAKQSKDEE